MARITIQNVEFYLECLNNKTKNHYELIKQGEPTKYTLVIKNEHGGIKEQISRNNLSTAEIYEVIYSLNNMAIMEQ